MADREELIEILRKPIFLHELADPIEAVADYLLDSGVTINKRGEWTVIEDDWNEETIYQCPICKEEFVTIDGTPADNLWNYCPACGADMREPPKGE